MMGDRRTRLLTFSFTLVYFGVGVASLRADYVQFVTDLGPIGFWRLGETSGDTAVDRAAGNDGTYHDVILGRPGAVFEDPDTSVEVTGSPSHIEIDHQDEYLLEHGTVSLLFFDLNNIENRGLFSKDSNGFDDGGHLSIYSRANGRVRVRLQTGSDSFEVESEPVNDGDEWIHVVFTFGQGGMRLYINGDLAAADDHTGGLLGNQEPIGLGADTANSGDRTIHPLRDYFTGYLDEVLLFDRALADEEIRDLYRITMEGVECERDEECDDADPCTLDRCVDSRCVRTPVADDTPCPDGLFCNGDETCQAGQCADGEDPCTDERHCDEEADDCVACLLLGDSNDNDIIDMGDFNRLFQCLTGPVGPVDPPAYEEGCECVDIDADGDVDLYDFTSFEPLINPEAVAPIHVAAQIAPGDEDEVTVLPLGESEFLVGDPIFLEVWAQTSDPRGFASIYVDVQFDSSLVTGVTITPTELFDLFPRGSIDNESGLIREVGGSHLGTRGCEDQVGFAPKWARVVIIEMRAESAGAATIASADTESPFGISVCGSFDPPLVDYRRARLEINAP